MSDTRSSGGSSPARVQAVTPTTEVMTLQRLPYFVGISGKTVASTGLSMHLVVVPPAARADPHLHVGYETGIYVLEGTVLTRWGPNLEHEVVSHAGEFLFVPPGIPHEAINLSDSAPARAVVARNDPAEQDKVVPFGNAVGASEDDGNVVGPVQRQLDAYNARDFERFVAQYADDVEVFRPPAPNPVITGKAALGAHYAAHRFTLPALHARLVNRMVAGRIVVDHEDITGLPEGRRLAIAVYEVVDNAIRRVWFH